MRRIPALVCVAAMTFTTPSFAGLYTDDLSRCIVDTTSAEDKTNLMKWIFVAMAQHPSVAPYSAAKPADVTALNEIIGKLFMHLLTETCQQKARDAIRIEGVGAIQAAFQVLGQVAASGLFSDPAVVKTMSDLNHYVDQAKLDELSKPAPAAPAK